MRNIKELLELMLNNQNIFEEGLCQWAVSLYTLNMISIEEFNIVYAYIAKNRPKWYSGIEAFKNRNNTGYYWPKFKIKPRIEWIEQHIIKLS